MALSNTEKRIAEEEGRVKSVYQDSEGKWTIGIGLLVDGRYGGGLDDEEIDWLFNHRILKVSAEMERRFPWVIALDEVRYGALLSMCYQLGVDGVSKFLHMLASLKAGNWEGAAAEALNSKWQKQTPERAARVAKELQTGVWQWKSTGKS